MWLVEGGNPAVCCLRLQCKGYLKAGLRVFAKPKIFQVAFAVGGLLGQMAHPIKLPQPTMPVDAGQAAMPGRGLAVCREILYTAHTPVLRVSSNGKAPASQADYAGSIPVTRSNFFPMPFFPVWDFYWLVC